MVGWWTWPAELELCSDLRQKIICLGVPHFSPRRVLRLKHSLHGLYFDSVCYECGSAAPGASLSHHHCAKFACIDQVKQLWPMPSCDVQGLQPRFHAPFPFTFDGCGDAAHHVDSFLWRAASGEDSFLNWQVGAHRKRFPEETQRWSDDIPDSAPNCKVSLGLSTAVKSTGAFFFFCTRKMITQCDVPETGHHIGKTRVLEVTLISD